VILVDSNIPMYLVGAVHPNKDAAQRLLERAIRGDLRLVTDVEVLQEILHRYTAIRRVDAIQPALDSLLGVVDTVYPIEMEDVEQAKTILLGRSGLSARDAIHAAIMKRYEIEVIMTFDVGFDRVPGIRRFAE
jgi:predicted nucleic acid-binding protein